MAISERGKFIRSNWEGLNSGTIQDKWYFEDANVCFRLYLSIGYFEFRLTHLSEKISVSNPRSLIES